MENLLLVLDEVDDLFSMAAMVWRPVASFLFAVALFVGTGFVFMTAPLTVEMVAFALIALGLLHMVRERRQQPSAISTAQS